MDYISALAIFVVVVSPVLIPLVITDVHITARWRPPSPSLTEPGEQSRLPKQASAIAFADKCSERLASKLITQD